MLDPETGKYIPNEAESRLVEALRSGKYYQVKGRLRDDIDDDDFSYCCLGVACDISHCGKWKIWNNGDWAYEPTGNPEDAESKVLPDSVRKYLGWFTRNAKVSFYDRQGRSVTLSDLNDHGFSFNQIADIIEAGLVK